LRKIRGNSQESFLEIRGNSQESFTGKSGENVDSFSQEFLVTHSEEPGPRNFSIPGNFLEPIPKIFSRVPREYLEIFTNKSSE